MKNEANGDRITHAMGTMMDHRATEPTLVDNEDAKVTLDSIGEGVLRTDMHGNVIYLKKWRNN